MSNISVAEMLKIRGKWVEGTPFTEFVAEKKKISVRHAYNLIKKAVNNHEILRIPLPNRTVLYGLPEFSYQQKHENKNSQSSAATEEAVVQTVRQWRKIALRNPLPSEIADEIGISPEQSDEVARKTRDKTGWFMPNTAILDNATEKLGEVLCYLARKRDRVLKDFDYKKYPDDPEIVNIAKLGLKEHLEMLPKLDIVDEWDWNSGYVASWPSKALKYLSKNYEPKKR